MAKKPVLSQSRSCAAKDLQGYEVKTHKFKTLNTVSENNKSTWTKTTYSGRQEKRSKEQDQD